MRHQPTRPTPASALAVTLRAAVMAVYFGAGPAGAEPTADTSASTKPAVNAPAPGDRIAQFLNDHGLAPAASPEPSLARQVRDRAADWTSDLVLSAMNFLGVRYRRGGNTADEGFDCSGFTRHVFEASIGLVLPRRANEQAKANTLQPVNREQLKPGDLVFFNTVRSAFSHVGIYVGEGKFIHAPRTGGEVRVEDMRMAYWSKRFNGARRANTPDSAVSAGVAAPTPSTSKAAPISKTGTTAAMSAPVTGGDAGANAASLSGIVY